MNVVSFSFGQTSGFMLRRLMDSNPKDFDSKFMVVFENTGKEHDLTLEFGHRVETGWGVPIVWLEYTRIPACDIPLESIPEGRRRDNLRKKIDAGEDEHWFNVVDYKTAARRTNQNTPFDKLLGWARSLPNVQTRMCSVQLKLRTRDRFLRASGVYEFNSYIGIRSDESHRINEILANVDQYETPHFPLNDDGVTKSDVDNWWERQPFRLEIPNYLGNCTFCFLKKYWKRLRVAKEYPEDIKWAAQWEGVFKSKCSGDGAYFKKGESYEGLLEDAKHPEFDLGDDDVACSCSIGGYRNNNCDD